ncbi:MATE family efflux transporter [Actibacterium pelagium]|uniref:MATE family efflux transporter n=1 Tax=Actibacterium pelagium TaxID=2029103 RepID=A0A917EIB4_9RHOB|nr:MATE family efflux transporter [Actibacterium pelagium]GGE39467.1 MATE family efflux transporter [Actibacterium pelagium]
MAEAARPVTHRRVLKAAIPVVLSNATVPILGAVDTGVVGQIGEAAPIGAVGIGAIILTSIYWVFGFLRMGTAGLTGQALGAGDREEVSAILSRALLVASISGVGLIALQTVLFWGAFWVSPASDEVETLARDYMAIRIWSAPAAIGVYGLTGWLVGQERMRAVLVIQLWMNGLNIVLDIWFVLGLGWGVEGVAIATFLAEWSGLAMGLYLCRDAFDGKAWRDKVKVFNTDRLARMARVGRDILIRSVLLQAIFVSFMFFGADFGDVPLAANQILLQFLYITAYAMDGFAFASEAFVAQALGARRRDLLRQGAIMSGGWAFATMVGMAIVFAFAGGAIIDAMTTAPDVREAARDYLPYMVAAPILGCAAWMFDGIFIGATRATDMRNMMVISALIYLAALLVLTPIYANHGLWAALLISFVARGITLALRYPSLEADADQPT